MINLIIASELTLLPSTLPQALFEVDIDPLAERLMVIDRINLETLIHCKVTSGVRKFILPMKYTTTNNLLVLILDDDEEYNAAAIDGVKLQIIDGIITDIRA